MVSEGNRYLVSAFILLLCITGCKSSKVGASSNAQVANDNLSKYTIEQLRQVLSDRRNQTLHSDTPEDLKTATDQQIVDTLIYRQKTIYGSTDRRKDYYDIVTNPDYQRTASSVAALIPPDHYHLDGTTLKLVTTSLGISAHLCSGESYADQPSAAYCTAFVVAGGAGAANGVSDRIATAGHCIRDDWKSVRVVFNYRMVQEGQSRHLDTITPDDVYEPKEILANVVDQNGVDYGVLRVDRPIKNHPPLNLRPSGSITNHEGVYTMGYPAGLPLKLAANAAVRDVIAPNYFVSNLDTFGGNSGSPVLNASTHLVEGILVRGDHDWVEVNGCQVALVCPTHNGCRGEDATLITSLKQDVVAQTPINAGGPEAKAETKPSITKVFSSGPRLSGVRKAFSPEYQLVSDPPPAGYKIGTFTYSLSGDRACNSWSTCRAAIEGDRVVFRFSMQGHDEFFNSPGQAVSEGHLTVTYVPI